MHSPQAESENNDCLEEAGKKWQTKRQQLQSRGFIKNAKKVKIFGLHHRT